MGARCHSREHGNPVVLQVLRKSRGVATGHKIPVCTGMSAITNGVAEKSFL